MITQLFPNFGSAMAKTGFLKGSFLLSLLWINYFVIKTADLTTLIQKDPESGMYLGQIEEFPAAISQGKTIDELKINLINALKLLLDVQI